MASDPRKEFEEKLRASLRYIEALQHQAFPPSSPDFRLWREKIERLRKRAANLQCRCDEVISELEENFTGVDFRDYHRGDAVSFADVTVKMLLEFARQQFLRPLGEDDESIRESREREIADQNRPRCRQCATQLSWGRLRTLARHKIPSDAYYCEKCRRISDLTAKGLAVP